MYLWRVESDRSRAQYVKGKGILAESGRSVPYNPRGWKETRQLGRGLMAHLDWSNRVPTPFVSVSSNRDWVFDQARRRCREGETGVRVYKIKVPDLTSYHKKSGRRVTCMKLKTWLNRAGCGIPEYADFQSSEDEYLFLHHIPKRLIVKVRKV
ncbi:hypothetical protein ASPCADRAFT_206391 [Aspergillus carbonarius ITEM 5010]|uniref:DUF7587 domain-containing protein n=1 Tax=Aspergillus carbonarius (strain ITEM 5010) TaxID=602072 RepID=A0A1R3RSW6_ASPC5|nr:hypothetical protein ASPCADRAFT_206391 [Aspergillus carbonarius ITEM 5010]